MKNYYKNIKKIAGLAGLSMLIAAGLVSCDTSGLTDTIDEFGVVVELDPINTSTTVLLYDAVTGQLIERNVTVTYSGEYGDQVIDSYSDPISTTEVSDGILGFGVENSVAPSESNPASIRLVLEADGYITKTRTIELTQEGKNEFSIEMTAENNKPQGVETSTNTDGQADESGAVQQDFNLESSSSNTGSGSSVEVASGTIFQDEDGNALTGQLTSSMTYYDPSESSAMSSTPVDLTDEEGNPLQIIGGASVEVRDSNGRRASSATGATGGKGKAGELTYFFSVTDFPYYQDGLDDIEVPVMYWNSDYTRFRTTGTIQNSNSENRSFQVKYSTDIVPIFAVILTPGGFTQSKTFTIDRNGRSGTHYLYVTDFGYDNLVTIPNSSNSTITMNAPINLAYGTYTSAFEELNVGSDISDQQIDITLPAPATNRINAFITVDLVCSNGGVISTTDLPGASIVFRKAGSTNRWATATNIQFQTNTKGTALQGGTFRAPSVEQGADYNFKVNFDGESYNKVISITGQNVTTDYTIDSSDVCTVN